MSDRPKISAEAQAEVLLQCARRCCLCFGLHGDSAIKKGQIAHLNHDRALNHVSNLVYLCFDHHDEFDSTTRQSKGLAEAEVATYRMRLHEHVQASSSPMSTSRDFVAISIREQELVLETVERYWKVGQVSPTALASEIALRMRRIRDFLRLSEEELNKPRPNLSEVQKDEMWKWSRRHFREALSLPEGIWGLQSDGHIPEKMFRRFDQLSSGWANGVLSYSECHGLYWLLDEELDFDQYYILYGLPIETIGALGVIALDAFIYEFGMRKSDKPG
jgi:hypothetical protein